MSEGDRLAAERRLKPAHALTGAIVLLVTGLAMSVYQDRVFHAQQIREMTVQGQILAASVTAAIVFGDATVVQEHVDALKIDPEIEAAGVYGTDGALLGGFVREGKEPLLRTLSERAPSLRSGKLVVIVPAMQQATQLGTVHIRAIDVPLDRRITRHIAIMLLAVMAALLLAFMGTAQRTLGEANRQLEARAIALAESNRLLHNEMEERSKAEEALRQSQKMEAVGQLSGGLAHDFNNLLTIIQGNLHLMKIIGGEDRAAVESTIASANEAVDRAGHLVRRLLAFSRQQPLSPRSVDINELLIGMKDLFLHSVGERVLIEWKLESTWRTLCDVNQLENVILNLAINARDAMPSGGTLTIRTRNLPLTEGSLRGGLAAGDYLELNVEDTGTGMTDEVLERAFDPFFTTKPVGQGTGLGLSMAFAFIRQSNGHMNIETRAGKGTTIVIVLPRDPNET